MNLIKYLTIVCCLCVCIPVASHATPNCHPTVSANFNIDGKSVTTISSKDLSNVVLTFCDGSEDKKFDGLSGFTGVFSFGGKQLSGVYIKSGCNQSGDGPGYGEFIERECTTDCEGVLGGDAVLDECGVCNGNGPGQCGCNLSIVKDECGICGGPGEGPCGCQDVIRDECGICGGPGTDECNRCPGDSNYGESCNECEQEVDECGVCGGSGKDSCGFCPEDSNYGIGKDSCGHCPQDPEFNTGECLDCLGIPNGPNVKDIDGVCCPYANHSECGRCDGPGPNECGSCAGDLTCTCEHKSIFEESIEIDSYSHELYRETKKAGKVLKKFCSTRNCKKLVKKLTLEASDLHMKIWTDIWTIGGEYVSCDPDACPVVSLSHIKQSLKTDYITMQKGVRKLYKKAFRRSGGRKAILKKLNRSNSKTKAILQLIDFALPEEESVCN